MYHRSTTVTRDVLLHPTSQSPSSSPATHVSLGAIENSTTPGWSGRGPPTSSPVSPPIPTSPSVSSLRNRPNFLRRSLEFVPSPDPLQLISPSRQHDEEHGTSPSDHEMLDPTSSSNGEGRHRDAMPRSSSPPPISPMQPSPSADPFVVPAPASTEANREEAYLDDGDANAAGGRYSMRTRQPRQLKPYAFDRLEYKHQLKHHPDAIVRFAGLRNPVQSSPSPTPSNAGESGSDGAAGNSASERPSDHVPHTNGKKRRRTGANQAPTTHQETSRVRPPTTPLGRVRRMSTSPVVDVFPRAPSSPVDDVADAPMPWYPDAFNDMSSELGSEEEPLSVVQQPLRASQTPPPRAKRRRVIAWFQQRVCIGLTSGSSARSAQTSKPIAACLPTASSLPTSKSSLGRNDLIRLEYRGKFVGIGIHKELERRGSSLRAVVRHGC